MDFVQVVYMVGSVHVLYSIIIGGVSNVLAPLYTKLTH